MNIIIQTYDKIGNFAGSETRLLTNLMSSAFSKADSFTKGAVARMIRLTTPATNPYELQTILRCVDEIVLFGKTPVIFMVNEGEDFAFEVDLAPGKSFSGYGLQAFNAETGISLGPEVAGSSAAKQDVPVIDLDLPMGHTYRTHVVLTSNGEPSNVLITEAFLIVDDNIDYGAWVREPYTD